MNFSNWSKSKSSSSWIWFSVQLDHPLGKLKFQILICSRFTPHSMGSGRLVCLPKDDQYYRTRRTPQSLRPLGTVSKEPFIKFISKLKPVQLWKVRQTFHLLTYSADRNFNNPLLHKIYENGVILRKNNIPSGLKVLLHSWILTSNLKSRVNQCFQKRYYKHY